MSTGNDYRCRATANHGHTCYDPATFWVYRGKIALGSASCAQHLSNTMRNMARPYPESEPEFTVRVLRKMIKGGKA